MGSLEIGRFEMLQTDVINKIGVEAYLVLCKLADIELKGQDNFLGKKIKFIENAMKHYDLDVEGLLTIFNCRLDLTKGEHHANY